MYETTEIGTTNDATLHQLTDCIFCTKCQSYFKDIELYFFHKKNTCAENAVDFLNEPHEFDKNEKGKESSVSVRCPLCFNTPVIPFEEKSFVSVNELINHLKSNCPQHSTYIAKRLIAYFSNETSESSSGKHSTVKSNENNFQQNSSKNYSRICRICNKGFRSRVQIIRHYIFDHNVCEIIQVKGRRIYSCKFCSSQFQNRWIAVQHYLRKHCKNSRGKKPIACHKCCKSFKYLSTLRRHMKVCLRQHAQRSLQCSLCDKRFVSSHQQLNHHIQVHSRRRFKCTFTNCSGIFLTPSHLLQHLRMHSEDKPFVCSFVGCEYAAKTKYALDVHMGSHEDLKRKFSCDYCDYRATTASMLTRHLRTHVACKPYSCPHCPSKFVSMGALSKHVLQSTKHTNLCLYNCRWCTEFQCNSAKLICHHVQLCHPEVAAAQPSLLTNRNVSQLLGIYNASENKLKPAEGETICQPIARMPRGPTRTVKSLFIDADDQENCDNAEIQTPPSRKRCRKPASKPQKNQDKKTDKIECRPLMPSSKTISSHFNERIEIIDLSGGLSCNSICISNTLAIDQQMESSSVFHSDGRHIRMPPKESFYAELTKLHTENIDCSLDNSQSVGISASDYFLCSPNQTFKSILDSNVAVSSNDLHNVDSWNSNVAVSSNDLQSVDSGNSNVAVSSNDLQNVDSWNSNVAVSSNDLQNVDSGNSNVAVSSNDLQNVDSGNLDITLKSQGSPTFNTGNFNLQNRSLNNSHKPKLKIGSTVKIICPKSMTTSNVSISSSSAPKIIKIPYSPALANKNALASKSLTNPLPINVSQKSNDLAKENDRAVGNQRIVRLIRNNAKSVNVAGGQSVKMITLRANPCLNQSNTSNAKPIQSVPVNRPSSPDMKSILRKYCKQKTNFASKLVSVGGALWSKKSLRIYSKKNKCS